MKICQYIQVKKETIQMNYRNLYKIYNSSPLSSLSLVLPMFYEVPGPSYALKVMCEGIAYSMQVKVFPGLTTKRQQSLKWEIFVSTNRNKYHSFKIISTQIGRGRWPGVGVVFTVPSGQSKQQPNEIWELLSKGNI